MISVYKTKTKYTFLGINIKASLEENNGLQKKLTIFEEFFLKKECYPDKLEMNQSKNYHQKS